MSTAKQDKTMTKVLAWYYSFCKKYGLASDLFDIAAEIDSSLSFSENRNILSDKLKVFLKPEQQLNRAEAKNLKAIEEEQNKRLSAEALNNFKDSIKSAIPYNSQISLLSSYLRLVASDSEVRSLIVKSRSGLGKTFNVLSSLKAMQQDKDFKVKLIDPESKEEYFKTFDFEYINGYITPLQLYKKLHDFQNSFIVFDDCEGLLKDNKAISLLKAATWKSNGSRLVCYDSTAKALDGIPCSFSFSGSIVLLVNDIPKRADENFKALIGRSLFFDLSMSSEEVKQISLKLLSSYFENGSITAEQKTKAEEILNSVCPASDFSLRDFVRIVSFVRHDAAQAAEMFKQSFKEDEELKLVYELSKTGIEIQEQYKSFSEQTGLSRRTFFNYRKQLKELLKADKKNKNNSEFSENKKSAEVQIKQDATSAQQEKEVKQEAI